MSWLNEHKRRWRTAVFILFFISMIGPWVFEQIHVPAQYECSAPFIRLEGDFCGEPLSGIWILTAIIGQLFSTAAMIVTGTAGHNLAREFLMSFFFILLWLPIFSILLLILSEEKLRYQAFPVAVWVLAVIVGLWFFLASSTRGGSPIQLWGLWVYIVLASTALILEITVLVGRKRPYSLKR